MDAPREPVAVPVESLLRLTAEAAPNAMLTVDTDQRIVFVNRGTEALFGYDRSELLGRDLGVLVPRWSEHHREHVAHYFAHREVIVMAPGRAVRALHKDGSELAVEVLLTPIEADGRRFTLASITDLGARMREERRLRLVVEAAPYALALVERSGAIALVNHRTEVQFGYGRSELVGDHVAKLVPEHSRATLMASLTAASGPASTARGQELVGLRRDGHEIPLELETTPVETPDGPFVLMSFLDVSERKRHEDDLRRSNAELEQFAYIASHDLQEPLRMVASYTELLAQRYRGQLDEKADRYIHFAVDGAKRMQRLVADLLSFSRVGSQGKPLVPVSTELVLRQVLDFLRPSIAEAGASIEHGPLPLVMADEGQLGQVLQNLIGNAMKFRAATAPRIAVRASTEGHRCTFAIEDNGIGIEPQYHDRIFQMFQRLHERGRYDGSGIGLSIAKRIIERHGGHVWLESTPGVGSTFFFTLPAVVPAASPAEDEP